MKRSLVASAIMILVFGLACVACEINKNQPPLPCVQDAGTVHNNVLRVVMSEWEDRGVPSTFKELVDQAILAYMEADGIPSSLYAEVQAQAYAYARAAVELHDLGVELDDPNPFRGLLVMAAERGEGERDLAIIEEMGVDLEAAIGDPEKTGAVVEKWDARKDMGPHHEIASILRASSEYWGGVNANDKSPLLIACDTAGGFLGTLVTGGNPWGFRLGAAIGSLAGEMASQCAQDPLCRDAVSYSFWHSFEKAQGEERRAE